jgi:hypothetical protein
MLLYRGPSALDSAVDIVVILTTGSKNSKTGAMHQLWILREDIYPLDAVNLREDTAICGDCKHRKDAITGKRSCYVSIVYGGPAAVYRSYKNGKYAEQPVNALAQHIRSPVRIGAYGDPAAVPQQIMQSIMQQISTANQSWTAYTHQWPQPKFNYLREFCMASVDNESEHALAAANGWRTFLTRETNKSNSSNLIHLPTRNKSIFLNSQRLVNCPASKEAGARTTCASCTLCNGKQSPSDKRASVWINLH